MDHLTDLELEAFFSRNAAPKVCTRVVRHLLSECDFCRKRAEETVHSLGLDIDLLTEIKESETCFSQSPEILRIAELIGQERKRATISFAQLAPLGKEERLAALRRHARYRKYGLALYVLDEVEVLILKRNPLKAKELLLFSMTVTDLLRPGVYGRRAMGDLALRQQTTFANVKRLEEDFMGALATLEEAGHMRHLGIDPREEARFYRVQADILFDLGEFEAAAEASAERVALSELVGDSQATAKAILQRSRKVPADSRRVEQFLSPPGSAEPRTALWTAVTDSFPAHQQA